MPENNDELGPAARKAQKEFDVIRDVLLVPLALDSELLVPPDQALPPRRLWSSECVRPPDPSPDPDQPDLVPVNPHPENGITGFCERTDDGKLLVTVRNQGRERAGASTTRVQFSDGTVSEERTPPIEAGHTADVPLDMPPTDPNLDFTITVNAKNEDGVVEANVTNNQAAGRCIG